MDHDSPNPSTKPSHVREATDGSTMRKQKLYIPLQVAAERDHHTKKTGTPMREELGGAGEEVKVFLTIYRPSGREKSLCLERSHQGDSMVSEVLKILGKVFDQQNFFPRYNQKGKDRPHM